MIQRSYRWSPEPGKKRPTDERWFLCRRERKRKSNVCRKREDRRGTGDARSRPGEKHRILVGEGLTIRSSPNDRTDVRPRDRQRIAEEKLDRLLSLIDRLSRVVELTWDFESGSQALAVDDALTQLERALAPEDQPPTAGPIRRARFSGAAGMNPDPLAEAAEAILFGDADEVADEVSDLNAAE